MHVPATGSVVYHVGLGRGRWAREVVTVEPFRDMWANMSPPLVYAKSPVTSIPRGTCRRRRAHRG